MIRRPVGAVPGAARYSRAEGMMTSLSCRSGSNGLERAKNATRFLPVISDLDRAWNWIAARPARLAATLGTLALVASAGNLLITFIAKGEMHWLEFGTSVFDKALIGSLLVVVGAIVELRRKRDESEAHRRVISSHQRREVRRITVAGEVVATGWSPIPTKDEARAPEGEITIGQPLAEAVQNMQEYATELDAAHSRDIEDDAIIADALTLGGGLERYLLEGGRRRRFLLLEMIYHDLAAPLAREEIESPFGTKVVRTREAIIRALVLKSHTDTVVLERLVVERRVRPLGLGALDEPKRKLLESSTLDSAAAIHEPLYLLLAFVSVNFEGDVIRSPELLQARLTVIRRCIGALRNEVAQLVSVMSSLQGLVEATESESSL